MAGFVLAVLCGVAIGLMIAHSYSVIREGKP